MYIKKYKVLKEKINQQKPLLKTSWHIYQTKTLKQFLKMFKELKQDVEKVNKMMYEHNGSVGKRVTKPKEKPKKLQS